MKPSNLFTLALFFALLLCFALTFSCTYNEGDCDKSCDDDSDDDDDDSVNEDVWLDESTGLIWQVDPTGETMDWYDACDHCERLEIGEYTDWRLPTISELRSLVQGCKGTETGGECGVMDHCSYGDCWNDACEGCYSGHGPDDGCYWPVELKGMCTWYWSFTYEAGAGSRAWHINFIYSNIDINLKTNDRGHARCVH